MTWNREFDSMGRRAGEAMKSGICWVAKERREEGLMEWRRGGRGGRMGSLSRKVRLKLKVYQSLEVMGIRRLLDAESWGKTAKGKEGRLLLFIYFEKGNLFQSSRLPLMPSRRSGALAMYSNTCFLLDSLLSSS